MLPIDAAPGCNPDPAKSNSMKAWAIDSYGGPEALRLHELPQPQVGANDVLIKVKAASLNPLDWKVRNGMLKRIRSFDFPLILGNDCAGVVKEVGSEVERFKVGDEVFTRVPKDRIGTLAEFISVDQSAVALKPHNLSFEEAAGIPLVALTAWQALHDFVQIGPGSRVLIQAGAGGVGSLALQIARLLGAEVYTTASLPKHELVRSLGAHRAIDYRNERFEDCVSDCDLVLDTLGGESLKRSVEVLKKNGVIVSISGPLDPQTAQEMELNWLLRRVVRGMSWSIRREARKHGGTYRFLFMRPDGKQLAEIAALLEQGKLKPLLDKVYSFEEAPQAFEYVEKGHASGKVVVRIGGE